jgi:hypothetical protein
MTREAQPLAMALLAAPNWADGQDAVERRQAWQTMRRNDLALRPDS